MNSYIGNKYQHHTPNQKDAACSNGFSSLFNAVKNCPIHLRNRSDQSVSTSTTEATEVVRFVSFAETASVRRTLSRDNYTEEERNSCWFTADEFVRIKRTSMALVAKMNSESSSVSKYCTRGLEKHTRVLSCHRLKNRYDSINAVLDEQDQMLVEGVSSDGERISRVYAARTSSSQLWAHIVGLQDRREAEKYF